MRGVAEKGACRDVSNRVPHKPIPEDWLHLSSVIGQTQPSKKCAGKKKEDGSLRGITKIVEDLDITGKIIGSSRSLSLKEVGV